VKRKKKRKEEEDRKLFLGRVVCVKRFLLRSLINRFWDFSCVSDPK